MTDHFVWGERKSPSPKERLPRDRSRVDESLRTMLSCMSMSSLEASSVLSICPWPPSPGAGPLLLARWGVSHSEPRAAGEEGPENRPGPGVREERASCCRLHT